MTVHIDRCPNGAAWQHEWSEEGICLHCKGQMPDRETQFAQRLEGLLNAHCQENASNTPDFILAQYLLGCLATWNAAVQRREQWYGRPLLESASVGHSVPMSAPPPLGM